MKGALKSRRAAPALQSWRRLAVAAVVAGAFVLAASPTRPLQGQTPPPATTALGDQIPLRGLDVDREGGRALERGCRCARAPEDGSRDTVDHLLHVGPLLPGDTGFQRPRSDVVGRVSRVAVGPGAARSDRGADGGWVSRHRPDRELVYPGARSRPGGRGLVFRPRDERRDAVLQRRHVCDQASRGAARGRPAPGSDGDHCLQQSQRLLR